MNKVGLQFTRFGAVMLDKSVPGYNLLGQGGRVMTPIVITGVDDLRGCDQFTPDTKGRLKLGSDGKIIYQILPTGNYQPITIENRVAMMQLLRILLTVPQRPHIADVYSKALAAILGFSSGPEGNTG